MARGDRENKGDRPGRIGEYLPCSEDILKKSLDLQKETAGTAETRRLGQILLEAGRTFLSQGDPSDRLFLLVEGAAGVYRRGLQWSAPWRAFEASWICPTCLLYVRESRY